MQNRNSEDRYIVFIQDEYFNNFYLGIYKDLNDATDDINDYLEVYNVSIKKDDIKIYTSTFDYCFDTPIEVDDGNEIWVRGFIIDKEDLNV